MKYKVTGMIGLVLVLLGAAFGAPEDLWIHPGGNVLPLELTGPFVKLADGSLLADAGNATRTSRDGGKTWSEPRPIYQGPKPGTPRNGLFLRTRDGAVILVYQDFDTYHWSWDDVRGVPAPDVRLDVWSIRSLDEGKTWVDRQKIFDGYCGALIDIIQTRVATWWRPFSRCCAILPAMRPTRRSPQTMERPGRKATSSTWEGTATMTGLWKPTLTELKDGKLWMLLRTTWDRFWQAYSDDHGLSWRVITPSNIKASSSPGYLLRLASGRLVLVWNRLYRDGENSYQHLTRKDFAGS